MKLPLFYFLWNPVTSFLLGTNMCTLLSTILSDALSLTSSFIARRQLSHPCRTPEKIIVLPILIFSFQIAGVKINDSGQQAITSESMYVAVLLCWIKPILKSYSQLLGIGSIQLN
jgi:hypothetical protein